MKNKQRFIVIGTGRFVEETILPALIVLNREIEIVSFINKSAKVSKKINTLLPNVPVTNKINEIDFSHIDFIFCCIPLSAVDNTIDKLIKAGAVRANLVLTTPVLPLTRLKKIKSLQKFKATFAFEFTPFIKKFILANELINQNKIGKLKRIWLPHSGFLYHAMAQIRSLTSSNYPWYAKTYKYGKHREYHLHFKQGITASIIEPRDYAVGTMMVAGTKGIICDYPLAAKNTYIMTNKVNTEGQLSGFKINELEIQETQLEKLFYENLPFDKLSNKTIDKQINILASVELFSRLIIAADERQFSIDDTITEHLLCRVVRKTPLYFDPLAFFGKSTIKGILLKAFK
jgi:hypothetical protein